MLSPVISESGEYFVLAKSPPYVGHSPAAVPPGRSWPAASKAVALSRASHGGVTNQRPEDRIGTGESLAMGH